MDVSGVGDAAAFGVGDLLSCERIDRGIGDCARVGRVDAARSLAGST